MRYDEEGFVLAEDGTRLFYGVKGEGPAVVLLDGLGCDGFAWNYLQPALAKQYTVVHWHYRGHGRSGPPRDPALLDVPTLARDLVHVLDGLKLSQVILMGHSIGTQVAFEFFRLARPRCRALILICGTYGAVTKTFHGSQVLHLMLPRLRDVVDRHRSLARAVWSRVPARLAYRAAGLSQEIDALAIRREDFRNYWESIAHMDPELFLNMLRYAGEHSAEDLLPRIDCPTLVVAAERDTFTPPELAYYVAEHIPGAQLQVLHGGSHAAPVEQPIALQRAIEAFLEQEVSDPAPLVSV
ncbi:MAG: alpha/beta fold hydrolase [Polyangiales bacterium]